MKIAVISDTHLGFDFKGKNSGALMQAKQAFEIAVNEKADFVLMPGDFFDCRIPKQETWHEAFEVLEIPFKAERSGVKVFYEKNNERKNFDFLGIPVIAIHGNHEQGSLDSMNALDVLQKAGFLLHLHASKAIVEKNSEKVCIFCLSSIPEKYFKNALKAWNPKPDEKCLNILVIHQSFVEFLPFDDEMIATLSFEDLPKGFDFIINGHLHFHFEKRIGDSVFLMPGSTVATQIKNSESLKPKGFLMIDSASKTVSFREIPNQRKIFYSKLKFQNAKPQEVLEKVENEISGFLKESPQMPLIRVKCIGSLAKGFSGSDINLSLIEKKFSDKALLSLEKNFISEDFTKTIAELRELQKQKKSLSALGLEMLEKKLLETSFDNAFDVPKIFELLAEGRNEEVEKLLKFSEKN